MLDELIGQDTIKKKASLAISAALKREEPLQHVLLTSAGGGLGKTTFAQILTNECYSRLVSTTGACLGTVPELRNALIRLNPGLMLLIDEFHTMGKAAMEELLIVLEEGCLCLNAGRNRTPVRIPIGPFTLIAATTTPEAVPEPLKQRFPLHFRFDFYSVPELTRITNGMFQKMEMQVDSEVCTALAKRARGVPRIALRLSERVRDVVHSADKSNATIDDMMLAMKVEGIDERGLKQEERHLLRVLEQSEPRPISARSLSLSLGVSLATITNVIEPTLVRLGLVTIGTGGRRISPLGIEHLQTVGNEFDG